MILPICFTLAACGGGGSSKKDNSNPDGPLDNKISGQWEFTNEDTGDYDAYVLIIKSNGDAKNYAIDYQESCYAVDEYELEAVGRASWTLISDKEQLPVTLNGDSLELQSPIGTLVGYRPDQDYDMSDYYNCETGSAPDPDTGISLSDLRGQWQLNSETHYLQIDSNGEFESYEWVDNCYDQTEGTFTKSGENEFYVEYDEYNKATITLTKEGANWNYAGLNQNGKATPAAISQENITPICYIQPITYPDFDTINTKIKLDDVKGVWKYYIFGKLRSYVYITEPWEMRYFTRNDENCFIKEDQDILLGGNGDGWFNATHGGGITNVNHAFNRIDDDNLAFFTHYVISGDKFSRVLPKSNISSTQLFDGYCE